MPQGESSREIVRWKIQEFLYNGPATSTKIVEVCNAAKATVYKYLNELCEEEKVIWKPKRGQGKSTYELSDKVKDEVRLLLEKQDFHKLADSLDVKWLNPLSNMIHKILDYHKRERHEDPYDVFNSYCFVFMDEMPFAFGKVPGALTEHIAFEHRLRKRRSEDIDKFEEEFFRTHVEDAESRKECLDAWVKELGGTMTEYYRKLKKKAKKMPFPQSMWMVMGYSDEEIDKMLAEEEEQYARMQKHKGDS